MEYCTKEEVIEMIDKGMIKPDQIIGYLDLDGNSKRGRICNVYTETSTTNPGVRVYQDSILNKTKVNRAFISANRIMIEKGVRRKLNI